MTQRSPFGEFVNEKIEQVYLESLRRLTLEQRWRAVAAMRQVAVEMVRAKIRAAHPEWSEQSVRWETTRQVMAAHGLRLGRTIPALPAIAGNGSFWTRMNTEQHGERGSVRVHPCVSVSHFTPWPVEPQFQAVQQVLERLEAAGIAYAVTGSWVVSSYGLLRNTHDLELVMSLAEAEIARLVAARLSVTDLLNRLTER